MQEKASNGGRRKSDKRERIRIPLKRETDCHGAKAPRNDRGVRIAARLAAVSPAGSVDASASQRCPPDTRTAMTRWEKTAVLRLLLYIIPQSELRIPHYFIIMVLKKQTAAKNSRLFLSLAVIRLFRQRIRKPLHRRL